MRAESFAKGWGKVTAVIAGLGTIAAAYNWPVWPTDLVVEVGNPPTDPMQATFKVKNSSVLFAKTRVQISCVIVDVRAENGARVSDVQTYGMEATSIEKSGNDGFKCYMPFKLAGSPKILSASVSIRASYDQYPWSKQVSQHDLGTFSWDAFAVPPQWISGRLLGAVQ